MKNLLLIVIIALLNAGSSYGQKPSHKSSHFTSPVPDSAELVHLTGDILFGEGPLWHPDGFLLCTDMEREQILKIDPNTGTKEVYLSHSGAANGLAFDPQGRIIMCREEKRDLARLEFDGTVTVLASHYDGKRFNSPNDLVVRSDGTVFFTDPFLNSSPRPQELDFMGVFAWTPDGKTKLLDASVYYYCNGITLSPDQKNLYVNNALTKTVYVFDIEDNLTITNKRAFTEIPSDIGLDGMKVNESGVLFVSVIDKGVWIYSPEGELVDTINITGFTTNINWGDNDYKTLYITELNNIYKIRLDSKGIVTPIPDPVYPINSALKANYVSPSNDQVIFKTEFNNPDNLSFTAQAFITGMDIDFVDSIPLFDDGMHYDNDPGDGIFGNTYSGITSENLFSLAVKTKVENLQDSFSSFESRFTTVGPVVINGLINMERDTVPDPGDSFLMKFDLKNKGAITGAKNVSAIILSVDTTMARLSKEEFIFGDIEAGASAWSETEEILYIDENCSANTILDFSIDIMMEDYVYWRDTFQIKVGQGFISGLEETISNKNSDIHIYPNPTSGIISISGINQPAEVKIYSIQGQIIKSEHQVDNIVDFSELKGGIYILNLITGNDRIVRKIVVNK